MPVVQTHHKLLIESRHPEETFKNSFDINGVVTNITFQILKESPGLVADVAAGKADRELLRKAIIKDIDTRNFHFGLYREELIRKVFDFMFGYGQLQPYIEDEDITDIDGTRYNEFYIKKNGIRSRIPVDFGSEKAFDTYCKLIAIRNGGIINENDSHCRVSDTKLRLRINVSIKPRNTESPSICIRKHCKKSYSLKDLEDLGMLNGKTATLLAELAGDGSATVLFCGKGAAGKTTLLRAFINSLPELERVLIVETDAEIFADKPCCISQRVRKENEGGRPVTLKELVRDGLTMSLDTYCIGEIVGDEAWEFIKASFTGHRGLATIHSENAQGVFHRLLTLSKGANIGESEKTAKEMIGKSINYIVHLRDFKVTEMLEVKGYDPTSDSFKYDVL